MAFAISIADIPEKAKACIEAELPSRAARATNALINAKDLVLRGQRSGRVYGGHQASAPGEPPAQWSGNLRTNNWEQIDDAHLPAIVSHTWYANLLENGTAGGQMAPRPFKEPILEKSIPEVSAIYSEPWHISF